MGAYSLRIEKPLCRDCGKPATEHVFNTYNAKIGAFCRHHAKLVVEEINKKINARNAPLIRGRI